MDALVQAALDKVNEIVNSASSANSLGPVHRKDVIAKAVNAVDALKSALKAL